MAKEVIKGNSDELRLRRYQQVMDLLPVMYDERVLDFVRQIGPKAEEYLKNVDECALIQMGSGATFYTYAMGAYLAQRGKHIDLVPFDKNLQCRHRIGGKIRYIYGRKILGVDDSIATGTAWTTFKETFDALQQAGRIKGYRYAVEYCPRELTPDEEEYLWIVNSGVSEEADGLEVKRGIPIWDRIKFLFGGDVTTILREDYEK